MHSFGVSTAIGRRIYSETGICIFEREYSIRCGIFLSHRSNPEFAGWTGRKKYDLIFCSEPPAKLNFTAVPVQKQDLVLIVPKDHPLASYHTIDLSETAPYPHIFFEKSAGIRFVIDQMFSQIKIEPKIAYETEEDQVIAGLVAQGFGIAVVPYMDLLLKLDVKILQINSPACERNLFMINDESVFMPPCVQSFRKFVLNKGTSLWNGNI